MLELFYLQPSPFSHRARWALDHHKISYTTREYAISPFYLMELPLRWRLGKWRGSITAPILLETTPGARSRVIMDSTEIAICQEGRGLGSFPCCRAGAHGASSTHEHPPTLFPADHAQDIDRWLACSDALMSLSRRELTAAALQHAAIRETLLPADLLRMCGPPDSILGRLLRWLMRKIFAMLSTKYSSTDAAADAQQVHKELQAASQRLAAHPHQLLLPEPCTLSWADIALATAINKAVEMQYKQLPGPAGSPAQVTEPSQAEGVAGQQGQEQDSAGAGVVKPAAGPAVISFLPLTQQLLQAYPRLVEWADATVRRYWPDGVSTLYKPVG